MHRDRVVADVGAAGQRQLVDVEVAAAEQQTSRRAAASSELEAALIAAPPRVHPGSGRRRPGAAGRRPLAERARPAAAPAGSASHACPLVSAWSTMEQRNGGRVGGDLVADLAQVGAGVEGAGLRVVGQGQVVQRQRRVCEDLVEGVALLDQHLGDPVEPGDVAAEDLAVLLDEAARPGPSRRRGSSATPPAPGARRRASSDTSASDWLNRRTVVSFLARVLMKPSSLRGGAEELVLVVVEGGAELAEVLDGLVELRSLAAEVRRGRLEQVGQRALRCWRRSGRGRRSGRRWLE